MTMDLLGVGTTCFLMGVIVKGLTETLTRDM